MEIVEALVKQKIPEDQIYQNFTVGAATPLITAKDKERTDGLNYVTACLKRGEKVTQGDLQSTFKGWKETEPANPRPEKSCKFATPQTVDIPKTKPSLRVEPVPPAPIAQTLKEKYGGLPESPSPQTLGALYAQKLFKKEISTDSIITDTIGQVSPISDIPWNCGVLPCPGGQDHIKVDKLRGKCCDLLSLPCNQLEKKRCPVLNGQVPGFTSADEFDPVTGGKFIKREPYKITKAPITISFSPSGKQQEFIERVVKSGEFESPIEFLSALVDRAMEES
jgi:hypothetical protein